MEKRIKLIMIMAITADGKIAQSAEQPSIEWTSQEDKKFFSQESKNHKVLIIGQKTFATFKKPLPNRLNLVVTLTPEKFKNQPGIVEFSKETPEEITKNLAARGFTSAVVGGGATINSLFLNSGLVDEIYLTIEPILFGQGINLINSLNKTIKLELINLDKLNQNTILAKYRVIN